MVKPQSQFHVMIWPHTSTKVEVWAMRVDENGVEYGTVLEWPDKQAALKAIRDLLQAVEELKG